MGQPNEDQLQAMNDERLRNNLPPAAEPVLTAANQKVLHYIQDTFDHILREIQIRPCGQPTIVLKRIVAVKPRYAQADSTQLQWHVEDREIKYGFPGKNKDESWRFGGTERPAWKNSLTVCPQRVLRRFWERSMLH